MENKQLLGLAIVFGVGYAVLGGNKESAAENYYFVPGVGDVAESDLPDYGYIKYSGKWILKSDLMAAAQANGIAPDANGGVNIPDTNNQVGWDIFNTLLSIGAGLTASIINNNAAKKADLIEEIKTKYTVLVSTSYDPNFPYTDTQLNGFTIAKLEKILEGDFTISGYQGKYSSSYKSRPSRHWTQNL